MISPPSGDKLGIPMLKITSPSIQCWNSKVQSAFKIVDEIVSNPKMLLCYTGRLAKKLEVDTMATKIKSAFVSSDEAK